MIRRYIALTFSLLTLGAAGAGVYAAAHSELFLVQVVEVADQPEQAPVDAKTITELAAVPTGKVSLFTLDLRAIERRILVNPWVKAVALQKRFPQTVAIAVTFREPRALIQSPTGGLAYLDADGNAFAKVNLALSRDLPVLTGFAGENPFRVSEALRLLDTWEKSELTRRSSISSLAWDRERGYRVLATYPLQGAARAETSGRPVLARVMIDLGQEIDARWEDDSGRLAQVFRYLSQNSIAAHQIWADAGKKIVVKTARGS